MAPLKFRVWDSEINEYRKEGQVQLSQSGVPFILVSSENGLSCQVICNVIIEKHIGLSGKQDKKEWFEGDIIGYRNEDSQALIVWDNIMARFGIKYINSTEDIICELSRFHVDNCILLGNIHQNNNLYKNRKWKI